MFLCGWFMIDRKRREVEKKASGGAKVYNGVNVVGGLVDEEEKMVTTWYFNSRHNYSPVTDDAVLN